MAVVQTFARRQKPQWLRATEAATAALSIRRKVKWTHIYNTFSVVRQSSQSTQTFPFNKTDKPSLSIWRCQQGTLFDILSLYRKPISLLSVIPFIIIIVVVVVIFHQHPHWTVWGVQFVYTTSLQQQLPSFRAQNGELANQYRRQN